METGMGQITGTTIDTGTGIATTFMDIVITNTVDMVTATAIDLISTTHTLTLALISIQDQVANNCSYLIKQLVIPGS